MIENSNKPKLTWANFKKDKFIHFQFYLVAAAAAIGLLVRYILQ